MNNLQTCQFCTNELYSFPLNDIDDLVWVYHCYTCHVDYYKWNGNNHDASHYSFIIHVSNKSYEWAVTPTYSIIYEISKHRRPDHTWIRNKMIIELQVINNLTPANVISKLKTYLVLL